MSDPAAVQQVVVGEGDISAEDLRSNIAEILAELSTRRAVHAYLAGGSDLAEVLWDQAAQLGWLSIGLSEEIGGLGLGASGLAMLFSELGYALAPGAFIPTLVAAQCIERHASAHICQEYLPQVLAGSLKIAVSANLPDGGEAYFLGASGSALALVATAETLILVEPGDTYPVAFWDGSRPCHKMTGHRQIARLDQGDDALRYFWQLMALSATADSVGGSAAVSEQTVEYLKTRVQFDVPIGKFQALKHRVADQAVRIAVNRRGLTQAVEAAQRDQPSGYMWSLLAKASASEAYVQIAADCMQLSGGIGFTQEYDSHIFLKRARLNEALIGDSAILRDLAARELFDFVRNDQSTTDIPL